MRRNSNLWTSGVNLDTTVRFADPDFLLECKISAIWRRFPLIIAFYILNVRHISTSGLLDLLTYMAGHVSNSATKFEDPTTIFSCAESRDPWVGGQKRLHFGNPRPRFAYSLCNFRDSTVKVIIVVCENNALPCVKRRMIFCACATSRDLLKVSYVSCCSRSRRRRFTVLDFKRWAYRSIYGHFRQHLYCACAETVIYKLTV